MIACASRYILFFFLSFFSFFNFFLLRHPPVPGYFKTATKFRISGGVAPESIGLSYEFDYNPGYCVYKGSIVKGGLFSVVGQWR